MEVIGENEGIQWVGGSFKISSIAVFHEAQQALDCEKCKYLHPTNGLKLGTPMVELGEELKKFKGKVIP